MRVKLVWSLLKSLVRLLWAAVLGRRRSPKAAVVAVQPARGLADVVDFRCARGKAWRAFVPPGCFFDLDACAAQGSPGPQGVLVGTLVLRDGRRIDVTEELTKFAGPAGDFYCHGRGLPPPHLEDIVRFLAPDVTDFERATLEMLMASLEVHTVHMHDRVTAA